MAPFLILKSTHFKKKSNLFVLLVGRSKKKCLPKGRFYGYKRSDVSLR